MKDLFPLMSLLALGLFLAFLQLASSRTFSQSDTTVSPRAATPLDNSQRPSVFLGRILERDGRFVLRGSLGYDTYLLDDQEQAEYFEGRYVKVVGMLDATGKTIHVL